MERGIELKYRVYATLNRKKIGEVLADDPRDARIEAYATFGLNTILVLDGGKK